MACFLPLPSMNIALGHYAEDKPEAQSTLMFRGWKQDKSSSEKVFPATYPLSALLTQNYNN